MIVINLNDSKKGFEYVIRHTDGTIAAGKIFFTPEIKLDIISSNSIQYARRKPSADNINPIVGSSALAASFSRDMMVYYSKEKFYREEYGAQRPSGHQNPEPVITMLPRVKYRYNIDPKRYYSESVRLQELVRYVSPYYRTYHKMRLQEGHHPSEKQLALNAALPVPLYLPRGCTFVRGAWIGGYNPDMVEQFKSKSAAAVLFSAR